MKERLDEIEVKLAYLEQANGELSDVVYQQRQEIDALKARIAALVDRMDAAAAAPAVFSADDEKPPHY